MDQKEIDYEIAQLKAILGIEGMDIKEEEEKVARKYLAGEISEKEFPKEFLAACEANKSSN